jgi:hypothetical protein
LINEGVIKYEKGILCYVNQKDVIAKGFQNNDKIAFVDNLDYPYNEGLIGSKFFYENTIDHQACSLLDTYVDFGNCSRFRVMEPKTIRVKNNSYGRMSCVWIHPCIESEYY